GGGGGRAEPARRSGGRGCTDTPRASSAGKRLVTAAEPSTSRSDRVGNRRGGAPDAPVDQRLERGGVVHAPRLRDRGGVGTWEPGSGRAWRRTRTTCTARATSGSLPAMTSL